MGEMVDLNHYNWIMDQYELAVNYSVTCAVNLTHEKSDSTIGKQWHGGADE